MRIIENSYNLKPHVVQPKGKSKKFYKCHCRLYNWHRIFQYALATSVENENCLDWFVEVNKKTLQGKSSLTEAIDTTRQIT